MQVRTVALAGGAIAIVGAALGGGYYFGRSHQTPASPAIQTQTPNQTATEQPPSEQPSSEQAPAMQGPYESAKYSAEQRYAAEPRERGAPHGHHRIGFSYFRDELASYGRWQYSDRWGQVCVRTTAATG